MRTDDGPLPRETPRGAVAAGAVLVAVAAAVITARGIAPTLGTAGGDFANYYTASRLVLEGVSPAPAYTDFAWFQRQMDRCGIEHQVGGLAPHPPPVVLPLLPLAWMDPVPARTAWTGINVALLAVAIALLARLSGLRVLVAALVVATAGYGLLNNFLFGQMYLLLTVSILAGLELERRGHPVAAGICLGALLPVKYVALPFVALLAWERRWKVVAAAAVTAAAGAAVSLAVTDAGTWRTFLLTVLPRHLRGEIQDPFAVALQTFPSLYRRLFLSDPVLSPAPLVESPALFALARSATTAVLGLAAIAVLAGADLGSRERTRRFRLAWIPVAVLALSPAGATYHFLLLTLGVALLVRLLLEDHRPRAALVLVALAALVNVPHFVYLRRWLPEGWPQVFAYSRLAALLLFAAAILVTFRQGMHPRLLRSARAWGVAAGVAALGASLQYRALTAGPHDGAHRLEVPGAAYARNLGLIVAEPQAAAGRLLFSYCELFENRYALWDGGGHRIETGDAANDYRPRADPTGSRVLFETLREGRDEIHLLRKGRAVPVVEGRDACWDPSGSRFVFVHAGRLAVSDPEGSVASLPGPEPDPASAVAAEPAWCGDGTIVFLEKRAGGEDLVRVDPRTGRRERLSPPPGRIADLMPFRGGASLLLSLERDGNRDVWAFVPEGERWLRLTRDPAIDREPTWDAANGRIVFTSDRGRGLGCTGLFWMDLPEELR